MALSISKGIKQRAQKVVVYGPEGIGKTTLASKFPSPLFVDTEGGTGHIDVARVIPAPKSWTELMRIVKAVKTERPCSTLVVDTADWAEQMCIAHVCAKYKQDGLEGFGYGKGHVYLAEEFGRLLDALSDVADSGINVVVTAHAQMRKFEQPDEAAPYDRWELKLQKKVAPLVKEWCDVLLFINWKTTVETVGEGKSAKGKARNARRTLYCEHHACWDAKNRWGLKAEEPCDWSVIAPHVPDLAASAPHATAAPAAPAVTASQPTAHVVGADATRPAQQAPMAQGPDPFWGEQGAPAGFSPGVSAKCEGEGLPDYFKPLLQLMAQDGTTMDEVVDVVAAKGYYTKDTPPERYDRGFVEGVLIAAWPQVSQAIKDGLPF